MSSRRRFLSSAAGLTVSALPSGIAPFALAAEAARPARAKACLLIFLDGGPSHIDLFDLKPDAPDEVRGPFSPIETTVPGTIVCEHLPRVARQMHRLVQIRSVRHEETVHDPAVYQALTGYRHVSSAGGLKVEDTDLPQIGCAFARADTAPVVAPRVVRVPEIMRMEQRVLPGQSAGVLGPAWDPFPVDVSADGETSAPDFVRQTDVSMRRLDARAALRASLAPSAGRVDITELVARMDANQRQSLDILARPEIARAFDLSLETPVTHDAYGRHRHGQSVLLARRLVEAGSRFVTVYWGREDQDWADGRGPKPANNPWDTHRNHFPLVKDSLLPRADQTLAALLSDLADRGLLEETLVVWMGEFGRTPRISRPWASRDHWPHAYTLLMAGAGLPGGRIFGRTDALAAAVVDDAVSPADITATIFSALEVDPATTVPDANGRPHRLSIGRALGELWS